MRTGYVLADARKALNEARHLNAYVDEVAVCFATEHELEQFVDEAKDLSGLHRMDHFNSVVRDRMVREDEDEEFQVRFEFLKFPGYSWRIEAMCILEGVAPLHEAALRMSGGEPVVVHASYKSFPQSGPNPEYFYNLLLTRQRPIAAYRNSYGRFAYIESAHTWYLKPRVNLRDQ